MKKPGFPPNFPDIILTEETSFVTIAQPDFFYTDHDPEWAELGGLPWSSSISTIKKTQIWNLPLKKSIIWLFIKIKMWQKTEMPKGIPRLYALISSVHSDLECLPFLGFILLHSKTRNKSKLCAFSSSLQENLSPPVWHPDFSQLSNPQWDLYLCYRHTQELLEGRNNLFPLISHFS